MNSELDHSYDKYENQSNEEFEKFLDDLYLSQEAEMMDRLMADHLYAQREYERLSNDF